MGSIVSRAGSKTTPFAIRTSLLTVPPHWLLNVISLSRSTCFCGHLLGMSVQTTSLEYIGEWNREDPIREIDHYSLYRR